MDAAAPCRGDPGRRPGRRRLRRCVHRELRDPRSSPVLARRDRPARHGRRRGALHQEPVFAALAERARTRLTDPRAVLERPPTADGADRNPPDQRRRGLRRHLALPGLDERRAPVPRSWRTSSTRPGSRRRTRRSTAKPGTRSSRWASCAARRRTSRPTCRTSSSPICRCSWTTSSAGASVRPKQSSVRGWRRSTVASSSARRPRPGARRDRRGHRPSRRPWRAGGVEGRRHRGGDNVFTMVRKIGQAKALLAADYAAQLQRSVGKVVFFAKHIDVMDQAEAHFAAAGSGRSRSAAISPLLRVSRRSTRSTTTPRSGSPSAR